MSQILGSFDRDILSRSSGDNDGHRQIHHLSHRRKSRSHHRWKPSQSSRISEIVEECELHNRFGRDFQRCCGFKNTSWSLLLLIMGFMINQ